MATYSLTVFPKLYSNRPKSDLLYRIESNMSGFRIHYPLHRTEKVYLFYGSCFTLISIVEVKIFFVLFDDSRWVKIGFCSDLTFFIGFLIAAKLKHKAIGSGADHIKCWIKVEIFPFDLRGPEKARLTALHKQVPFLRWFSCLQRLNPFRFCQP